MIKKNNLLLVTTGLEDTWGRDEDILFLGEWCKRFSRKEVWQSRRSITQPFIWADRKKLSTDHEYLENLHERVLLWLVKEMNSLHEVNHPVRYWRIILGPWLLSYIPTIWDRWQSIENVLKESKSLSTFIPTVDQSRPAASDWRSSIRLMNDDEWNYMLFVQIIKTLGAKNIEFIEFFREQKEIKTIDKILPRSLKYKIGIFFDFVLSKFTFNNTYQFIIYHSYFSYKNLIKLFLGMKKIPRLFSEFDRSIQYPIFDGDFRNNINKEGEFYTSFEEFLIKIISNDLPVAYAEGYKMLVDSIDNLPSAEVIMTANAHFGNELFKVWSAEQTNRKSQLIISSHGGALPSLFANFHHEEKISDTKIVWHKPYADNHMQLPPQKIDKINNLTRKKITLIGLDSSRYPYRVCTGPKGPLLLDDFNHKKDFIDGLDDKVRANFLVRPFPYKETRWETADRYIERFGDSVITSNSRLLDDYQSSKLIVCSYPQTTFSEAMHSGIPTILLYKESHWELHPLFSDLIRQLKSAKVIFSSALEASSHVNLIQEDPSIWWNKIEVIEARKNFFDMCALTSKDPIKEWSNFLQTTLQENKDIN